MFVKRLRVIDSEALAHVSDAIQLVLVELIRDNSVVSNRMRRYANSRVFSIEIINLGELKFGSKANSAD